MPFEALWKSLGGDPRLATQVKLTGEATGLPSRFRIADLASASIAAATLAAAELWAKRSGEPVRRVLVDRGLAAAAFRCERLLAPIGWALPSIWDPIAGDYRAKDGWIRLHTNYASHREAATRVLGVPPDKDVVAKAVAGCQAGMLEQAIVQAGGAAAALHTIEEWGGHPQGEAVAAEPLVLWEGASEERESGRKASIASPLSGIRVLDLTRVIAGPVGTRHLAAFGAEVLRIDPPGFREVGALLPETTRGKYCAALDLKKPADLARWERLVAQADVLVHGYRPGAMEALGYSAERLAELNPALIVVRNDAYGWSGPWANRRGFDSLVQMSTGIAHPGNDGPPTPLPAQALDHATGYLIAAAACRALVHGHRSARLSLARTAGFLVGLGLEEGIQQADAARDLLEPSKSDWGPLMQVPHPGRIEGYEVRWPVYAGALGRHEPRWHG
jgi:crotonobetainyl-CoA:carnitine CoA-transferase CaiB-like acyl-CoA transferase